MSLRICIVADGRSPIALSWIANIVRSGHEVNVVSTYPAGSPAGCASFRVVPIALSSVATPMSHRSKGASLLYRLRGGPLSQFLGAARRWVAPLDAARQARRLRAFVDALQPDLVHAMRIPYEGVLAAEALSTSTVPLLISVWGNDITLHARRSPPLAWLTRRTLARADGLHPDCERDLVLARRWGFRANAPSAVLPGNGGIDGSVFCPAEGDSGFRARWSLPPRSPIVLNPRGLRAYVRSDTFFQAIPLVLREHPNAHFVGLAMRGNDTAEGWVRRLGIRDRVTLLPTLSRSEVADLFRTAIISVSPSEHDGTPNTLLEAMACGSFPVAGDIPSLREWVADGVNGLLCDSGDPVGLATAVVRVLRDDSLRTRARLENQRIIRERAEMGAVSRKAEMLYALVSESRSQRPGQHPSRHS